MHNNAAVILGTLFVARCAAHCYNAGMTGIVCDKFLSWPSPVEQVRRLSSSFGVERFIRLDRSDSSTSSSGFTKWFSARHVALKKIERLSGQELRTAVLNLTISKIPVGDLIYDSYLRKAGAASIDTVDSQLVDEIREAFDRVQRYRSIMAKSHHIGCVASDSSYVDYGGLLRAATAMRKFGIAKVLADQSGVRRYLSLPDCYDFPWPRETDIDFVRGCLGPELTRRANGFFPPRRQSADELAVFQVGYGANMKRPDVAELRGQIGVPAGLPAVGIFVPMFDDAPHSIPDLLADDSECWLEETLKIAATTDEIAWLVRNHPYAILTGQTANFNRIIQSYVGRYPHIKVCPSDVATESLFPLLRASVSIASTASLELASVGIPGLICGRPYYADHGFVVRARSRSEYFELLRKVHELPLLTPAQVARAKEVAYVNYRCSLQTPRFAPQAIDLGGRTMAMAEIAQYWETAIEILKTYRFEDDPMWHNFRRMEQLGRTFLLRFDQIEVAAAG